MVVERLSKNSFSWNCLFHCRYVVFPTKTIRKLSSREKLVNPSKGCFFEKKTFYSFQKKNSFSNFQIFFQKWVGVEKTGSIWPSCSASAQYSLHPCRLTIIAAQVLMKPLGIFSSICSKTQSRPTSHKPHISTSIIKNNHFSCLLKCTSFLTLMCRNLSLPLQSKIWIHF